MSMIEVKTAELIGPALDWAVAKGEGLQPEHGWPELDIFMAARAGGFHRYSTDWAQGGPLIEKNDWALPYRATARAHLGKYEACTPGGFPRNGGTPLIAACRAIVAANLGDVVSVPAELVQQQGEGGEKV